MTGKSSFVSLADELVGLSRTRKRAIAYLIDFLLLPFSLWAAFVLRLGDWWPIELQQFWWLFLAAPVLAIPIFVRLGLYRAVHRYLGGRTLFVVLKGISLHTLLLIALVGVVTDFQGIPRSVFGIYWLVSLVLIGGCRVLVRPFFHWSAAIRHASVPVVIYGAGTAGAELARAMQPGGDYQPVAFIDDKRLLHNTEIHGLTVHASSELGMIIDRYAVEQVLLAIPSACRPRRNEVVALLEPFPVHVRTVPSQMDLLSGQFTVENLREIDIEDLLGREPVSPDKSLLSACIAGKSVMVTGAGGSIGSELCRQIVHLQPKRLVLFEVSEHGLYQIERELRGLCSSNGLLQVKIVSILGSVTDERRLRRVLKTFEVQTLYHTAAYKHVPLVEHNPIEGVINNVFGTWHTANAAQEEKVETFILISTDKAVRPTNVMGAAKRMAELIVQGMAERYATTRFSIVRFGNVLGSSGSVVPLFREQIEKGGPITVTHPDIIRYFMTIQEASQLVIQAGSMGQQGGDVFVLEMGEPVRILDLARRMVHLSGLFVKDAENPQGDIAIEFTGLRPGEKLFEEILLGNNVRVTAHPRIMRAQEDRLPWSRLMDVLEQLRIDCANCDSAAERIHLQEAVVEYNPQCGIEDLVWLAGNQTAEPLLSSPAPLRVPN